jgi:hypothetical protein
LKIIIVLYHPPCKGLRLHSLWCVTWNEAPKELIDTTQDAKKKRVRRPPPKEAAPYTHDGNKHVRRPRETEATPIDFEKLKRGQVDKTYAEFRKWLQASIPDQRRLGKCVDATDDDARLWIKRPIKEAIEIAPGVVP